MPALTLAPMTRMLLKYLRAPAIAFALVTGLGGLGASALAGQGPVVVELFTSQGCNTCPPADAYLGKLAKRKDIIALSFHVTYWDYLGWKDPFGSPKSTKRQRDYARQFKRGYVYTPQMVIDGQAEIVGSRTGQVDRAIAHAGARKDKIAVRLVKGADGKVRAMLPARAADAQAEPATVWMALIDRAHTTKIRRGENGGKALTYTHVVRTLRKVGAWRGGEASLELPVTETIPGRRDGCVVLVQSDKTGRILGAALMPF